MTTTTFGKRGLAPPTRGPARPANAAAPDRLRDPVAPVRPKQARSFADRLPIMTIVLIVFLFCIFFAERRLAFDIDRTGQLSLESLVALGGASYDRVVGDGQYWRLFLAPLLHLSASHVVGNAVALLFVGLRLEVVIGRAWLAAIFAISALGGEAGSLLGNAHEITTVGASGAISGLIGALFVVSFGMADPDQQRRMLRTAARFGVPALGPLLWGASGHVDYCAHSAGAVAGALGAMAMSALWSEDSHRPDFAREAAMGALVGLGASFIGCVFAASQYSGNAARAAQFIPASEKLDAQSLDAGKSAALVARYPRDPRSHIAEAIVLIKARNLPGAEAELRTAVSLASSDAAGPPVKDYAQAALAIVVADEGRRPEAKAMVAGLCQARAKTAPDASFILDKAKLCE